MDAQSADRQHRAVVVGAAGKQGREYLDLLPQQVQVVGLVDADPRVAELSAARDVPWVPDIDRALDTFAFDLAVVAVPHSLHFEITRRLLAAGRHVVKEKPFALTDAEACRLSHLARRRGVGLFTTVQRNYRDSVNLARTMLPLIGDPYWFAYDYHTNLPQQTGGWRARPGAAGGGVLVDMGYHAIDVIRGLFGAPEVLDAAISFCFGEMRDRRLEDVATIGLGYPSAGLTGLLNVSRHSYRKHERLEVLGTHGALVVEPGRLTRFSRSGETAAVVDVPAVSRSEVAAMLADYVRRLDDTDAVAAHLQAQRDNVAVVTRSYELVATRDAQAAATLKTAAVA